MDVLIIFLLFSLILKVSATPLNFSFRSFDSNHPEIFTENDASVVNEQIELTLNQRGEEQVNRSGRATFKQPLHLWDKCSGNLTNFTTHFTFIISSLGQYDYGDGLAFFLAPNGSRIPPNVQSGGGLGLVSNDTMAQNKAKNQFVAVEFDTYKNSWDPSNQHVGINIKSMKSAVTVRWRSDVMKGQKTGAWISYDSRQKVLSVMFGNKVTRYSNLSYVVDLAEVLPEWVTFGFSASTGYLSQINRICSWEFNSTSEIVEDETEHDKPPSPPGGPGPIGAGEQNPAESKTKGRKMGTLVTGLTVGVGASALIVAAVFISFGLRQKKGKYKKTGVDFPVLDLALGDDLGNGTGPRNFSYDELCGSTDNFCEEGKLGEGGFGTVYRGFLKDMNCYIAVKRVSRQSKQGLKEYVSEVKIISRMRHRNLVKLIGWCHDKELLLAYEFLPNGSLDCHLFKGKSLLAWLVRYKIAQDLASALLYLHEEGDQCVLHRDIKSSNVMLDSNFNAKLGDFGLARLVDHTKGCQTTVLAGTMGYMAPECFTSGKASKESDIYSFGIVALEIASGRRAVEPMLEETQIRIVEWVWELYGKGKILEVADQKLRGEFVERELERLVIVGLWCVHPDRMLRPTVRQILNVLIACDSESPSLPELPSEMPVPAYLCPPMKPFAFSSVLATSNGRQMHENSGCDEITDLSRLTTSSGGSSSAHSASLLINTT